MQEVSIAMLLIAGPLTLILLQEPAESTHQTSAGAFADNAFSWQELQQKVQQRSKELQWEMPDLENVCSLFRNCAVFVVLHAYAEVQIPHYLCAGTCKLPCIEKNVWQGQSAGPEALQVMLLPFAAVHTGIVSRSATYHHCAMYLCNTAFDWLLTGITLRGVLTVRKSGCNLKKSRFLMKLRRSICGAMATSPLHTLQRCAVAHCIHAQRLLLQHNYQGLRLHIWRKPLQIKLLSSTTQRQGDSHMSMCFNGLHSVYMIGQQCCSSQNLHLTSCLASGCLLISAAHCCIRDDLVPESSLQLHI